MCVVKGHCSIDVVKTKAAIAIMARGLGVLTAIEPAFLQRAASLPVTF